MTDASSTVPDSAPVTATVIFSFTRPCGEYSDASMISVMMPGGISVFANVAAVRRSTSRRGRSGCRLREPRPSRWY
ncbi:MAG TPA: hypothetical protein VGI78_15850 [Acetobacteraceae bacterium]